MPPNILRVHTEYVLVKSVDPKSCELSQQRRDWRIFPSPSVPCRNCGGEDRWCRHLIEFHRAKSYCHLIEQKRCSAFLPRRESISGEGPTSFPEDASMPYSGFKAEPTQFKVKYIITTKLGGAVVVK
ncbi:uncharacterized protein TNCV_661391 [Trichonephila clavipes]|nr:uncharacterized protein TNCV_661391 [Trichonephila clavipes]